MTQNGEQPEAVGGTYVRDPESGAMSAAADLPREEAPPPVVDTASATGGTYVRDAETGALVKDTAAAVPAQAEAPPAAAAPSGPQVRDPETGELVNESDYWREYRARQAAAAAASNPPAGSKSRARKSTPAKRKRARQAKSVEE